MIRVFLLNVLILLAALVTLLNDVQMDQVDVRIKALHLIRKLFALPGQHVAQEYRNLFLEFLNRFADKSSEVRLCAISCAKGLYMNNPSGTEALEVLSKFLEACIGALPVYDFVIWNVGKEHSFISKFCKLSSCPGESALGF